MKIIQSLVLKTDITTQNLYIIKQVIGETNCIDWE